MFVVSRPAIAMATSGLPAAALANHMLVNPSASASCAWATARSTVLPVAVRPMRMSRPSS